MSLTRLRANLERTTTPKLKNDVAGILDEQRREIAERIRANASHVAGKPKDTSSWWNGRKWDERLMAALQAPLVAMAQSVTSHVSDVLAPRKADPLDPVQRALTRGAARVTGINARTKDAIASYVASGIEEGLSAAELADAIEEGITLDGMALFDEYRAELIARTELMDAYNGAALSSYDDAGITIVQAIDGDGDEECAARDGQEFSVEEADSIEDHPNGTLDWVPVLGKAETGSPSFSNEKSPAYLAALKAAIEYGDRVQPTPIVKINAPPAMIVPAPEVRVEAAPAPNVTIDTTAFAEALKAQDARFIELQAAILRPRKQNVVRKADGTIDYVISEPNE